MKKKLTVTGTGDSLFVAEFPEIYYEQMRGVADFIRSCDVRMTNLETNLSDFNVFASAYSGGTWLNTRSAYLAELFRYGFNFFGTANNHAMDYSYGGLLSTIDVLDHHKVAHAGTGKSLEEAAKPAVLEANGQRIAIFAVDTSFQDPSRAGRATHVVPSRPGVNFLRHSKAYKITEEEERQLRAIAEKTRINFLRQMIIDTGYLPPDPPGFFVLGEQQYTTKTDIPATRCNEKDKKRLTDAVRKAKEENDFVFMMVHCHDNDGFSNSNPPEYLKEFTHACIDAGASGIFGGGCHSLRGIEIYNGAPIFYSLGDFIYQGLKVEHLPADFMEKYDVDIYASAEETLRVRSRGGKVGLHFQKENYQTILPKLEFSDGKMNRLSMLPVHLNFDRKDDMNGLPVVAESNDAQEIFEIIRDLSAPFGTTLKMENGLIIPED